MSCIRMFANTCAKHTRTSTPAQSTRAHNHTHTHTHMLIHTFIRKHEHTPKTNAPCIPSGIDEPMQMCLVRGCGPFRWSLVVLGLAPGYCSRSSPIPGPLLCCQQRCSPVLSAVLSCPALPCVALPCPACPVISNAIRCRQRCRHVLSAFGCLVLPCPALPCPACHVLSHDINTGVVLYCRLSCDVMPALPCLALPCPAMRPTLPCPALPA